MADSLESFHRRLSNSELLPKIRRQIIENIRRRGGASALLVTVADDRQLIGKTLEKIAELRGQLPVDTVIDLVQGEKIRVASFNMSAQDIENFMVRPWVVTSSDGTNGHPRKYASFPKKYRQYVSEKKILTLGQFIHQSSGKTAEVLNIAGRGLLKVGNYADIVIFDRYKFSDKATFTKWNTLSQGIDYVVVNGKLTLDHGEYTNTLNGKVLKK